VAGERKQAVTGVASSRWAGAITRAVEDQYQLGCGRWPRMWLNLRHAIEVLAARCALRPGELEPVDAERAGAGGRSRRRRGYRKRGRAVRQDPPAAVLRSRLNTAERALAAGRPSMWWVGSGCGAPATTSTPRR